MNLKEFFSFKKNGFFWWNIIAMILLAIVIVFGVIKWLDSFTHHGEAVLVPNVQGKTATEAIAIFRNHSLKAVVSDSTYVKEKLPGIVLDHNPPAGQKVKKGRLIELTINTQSIPLQLVPDVTDNSSFRQAEARIEAAGFKLAPSDTIVGEKDWVYGVKYRGNMLSPSDRVPMGATLQLVIGNGYNRDFFEEENDSTSYEYYPDYSIEEIQEVRDDTHVMDETWFE